ncbi:MAG: hypothetical protein WCQ94_02830 [Lachnospiraceae bacterium]|nr:hypothetical protein [Lachnospiraceae bacterium]
MKKKVTRIIAMIMMAALVITGALVSPVGKMKVEARTISENIAITSLAQGDIITSGASVTVTNPGKDLQLGVSSLKEVLNTKTGSYAGDITFAMMTETAPGYSAYRVAVVGENDVTIEGFNPGDKTPGADATSTNTGSVCSHTYEWVETEAATDTTDAKLAYKCSRCGHIDMWMTEANSAYIKTNREAADRIAKAPANGTVKLETGNWTSFYRNVIDALAKRPDVTVVITYNDENHNRKCITIPAGTDLTGYIDDKGYTGYKFLISKLGETPYKWGK